MKRFLTTAAIALSMTTAAQAANNTVMFASNYWRVTHIARNISGDPMCMMQSQISFADGPTGFVIIMWAKGKPSIYLGKTDWQFASDVQMPFSVYLDNGHRELFGVSKRSASSKFSGIFASISKDEIDGSWLDDFASSEKMTIIFRNGNESRWPVKMAGSRDASKWFQACIKYVGNNVATSPVPDVPTSQPKPVQPVPTKKPKGESI